MIYNSFYKLLSSFTSIRLMIFVSIFTKDIGLKFSFLMMLYEFGFRVSMTSLNELTNALSASVLGKCFERHF